MICLYGTDKLSIDVTENVLKYCKQGTILNLPMGKKNFNLMFGDPCPGQEKRLRILNTETWKKNDISEGDGDRHIILIPNNPPVSLLPKSEPFITFIIPTINRPTLQRTLQSLYDQNDPHWRAIIIFDNVSNNIHVTDQRVSIIELDKKAGSGKNSAGLVRNAGINQVITEWIGFVDDDDIITPDYAAKARRSIDRYNKADCIIFRMYYEHDVLPRYQATELKCGEVGISFCARTSILKQFPFIPGQFEDWDFIQRLISNNKCIMVEPYVVYMVRNYILHCNIDDYERYNTRFFYNADTHPQ